MLHAAMARRWRMLCGTERPSSVGETFTPWRLRVERVRTTTPSEIGSVTVEHVRGALDSRVRRALEDSGFNLLIVDPWATFFAGNENDKGETEAALAELRRLALDLGTTVVILHHLGKSNDARDPEDLWRGSSRLADWASTRVTLLPHFTPKGAEEAGLSSLQARRYLDVHFLRRDEPTEGFVAHLGHDGWWSRAGPVSPTPGGRLSVEDVARSCWQAGGQWSSATQARQSLGVGKQATAELLRQAVDAGALFEGRGPRGTKTYTLVERLGADWSEQVVHIATERQRRSSEGSS
jgi:hypothetical protein